jgi:ketosteroid isomerase-like protein
MSAEYVELLRRIYASPTLAEFGEALHPDAVFNQDPTIPDTDDYYGRDGFIRGTELWLEQWEKFRWTEEAVIDMGERVFMHVRIRGRAKVSAIVLDQVIYHLWTFKDGMPWRCQVFFDKSQALEAVRSVA